MARAMTPDEIRAFMLEGSRTGKLATVRSDGSPHVAPIWFTFTGDGRLVFLTGSTTVKAANIRRDPRVSVGVDLETMPFAWARVDGVASFDDDRDALLHWAIESCRRYVGDDRAEEFGRRNAVPGELLVMVHPVRLVGYHDITG